MEVAYAGSGWQCRKSKLACWWGTLVRAFRKKKNSSLCCAWKTVMHVPTPTFLFLKNFTCPLSPLFLFCFCHLLLVINIFMAVNEKAMHFLNKWRWEGSWYDFCSNLMHQLDKSCKIHRKSPLVLLGMRNAYSHAHICLFNAWKLIIHCSMPTDVVILNIPA